MITKEQKADVKARLAVRNPLQQTIQEIYHYFQSIHGSQPPHKEVVKLLAELAQDETKTGSGSV